jgi:hypothetical protein
MTEPWGRDDAPAVLGAALEPLPPALAAIVTAIETGEQVGVPEGARS